MVLIIVSTLHGHVRIALKVWIHLPGPLVNACSAARNVIASKASTAIAVLGQPFVFLDSFKSK